jgi:hypothetical protein
MKAAVTVVLLAALALASVSCAAGRLVPEPVIQRDATISREREDAEEIERTERKHTDPWKY